MEEAAKKDGRSRSGGANSRKRLEARGGEMEGRRYADESHGDGQSQGSCAPSAIGSRNAVCHGSRLVLA